MRFWTNLFCVAGVLLLAAARSDGYLREDHNYSVRLILNAMNPPLEGEAIVGVCAQLPDEAPEISAIDVYRQLMKHPIDYVQWLIHKSGPVETVGRMVTVHQLQHGLTGGRSEGVRQVAKNVVHDVLGQIAVLPKNATQERADDLCALGLALHLYGDSFSHERLKNPQRMYSTGIGHLFDSTMPDLPYYSSTRLLLWQNYLSSLPDLFPHSNLSNLQELYKAMQASQHQATGRNDYNLSALRTLFCSYLDRDKLARHMPPFNRRLKPRGCQAILDWEATKGGLPTTPRCENAWTLFSRLAIQNYTAYDQEHPDAPSREPKKVDYFTDSPFSKGPKW